MVVGLLDAVARKAVLVHPVDRVVGDRAIKANCLERKPKLSCGRAGVLEVVGDAKVGRHEPDIIKLV